MPEPIEPIEPPVGTPPVGTPPVPTATFTQEDVNRLVGQARTEGKSTSEAAVLETLGVSSIDDAKAALAAQRAADDAAKTELERERDLRVAAEAKVVAATAAAEAVLVESKLSDALRVAGVAPDRIAAALKVADRSAFVVNGTEVAGVAEAAAKLVADIPEFKGTKPGSAGAPPVGGAPVPTSFHDLPADHPDVVRALQDARRRW